MHVNWLVLAAACILGSSACARDERRSTNAPATAVEPGPPLVSPPPVDSSSSSQQPQPSGTVAMIQIPVSSKTATSAWPRSIDVDYEFAVRSHGGPNLGSGVSEFDWTLQVESRLGLVSVEYFRSDADVPGTPIGLFRYPLSDPELREFRNALTTSRLFELQPAMAGHPGYTQKDYVLAEPSKEPLRQLINNSDEALNAKLAPLPQKLNSMLGVSFKHPERAIALAIAEQHGPAGDSFEVRFTNVGRDSVCFGDPAWLVPSGPLHEASVIYAEFPPEQPGDQSPLRWQNLRLRPMASRPPREPLVTLDSAQSRTWQSESVQFERGKRYLAYFRWANYDGDATVNGVYRVRGRADSERVVIQR